MGRNKYKKQSSTRNQNASVTQPYLSQEHRAELDSLMVRLLEIGYRLPANSKEEWDQYIEMQKILNRTVELEKPIYQIHIDHITAPGIDSTSPEARLTKIKEFTRWAKVNGVRTDCLEIAVFPGYQLGLQATRDIAKDEEVLVVPRKTIFSEEELGRDPNIQNSYGTMTNVNLAYALILEKVKPQSFWKPYLDIMPIRYNTVLYYTVEQIESLRGASAYSSALRQCRMIARQYAYLYKCAHLTPALGSFTSMGQNFRDQFCYDLYRWAVSTVMTRENLIPPATPLPRHLYGHMPRTSIAALIPFWDMANHKSGIITSFYNPSIQAMQCAAESAIKTGEQFFIYYGDRSNADLLVHNGFIDPNNRKDTVTIKLGLSQSDPLYEQRAALLHQLDIQRSADFELLPAPDYISGKLLAFVRVFNMTAEQLAHWADPKAAERAADLLHIDCALETDHDSKTWNYLHTRLMLLLRVFPTKLEADELAVAAHHDGTKPLGEIEAAVRQYLVLEKRILLGALDYAKERCKA